MKEVLEFTLLIFLFFVKLNSRQKRQVPLRDVAGSMHIKEAV
jgi:hypothetical protein